MAAAFEALEQYLERVGQQRQSSFGRRFRQQFRDTRGTAELAMLAAPSEEEYQDFRQAVQAMTDQEKQRADRLTDQEIADIARRAQADPGNVAIFLNGYAIEKVKDQR